MLYFNKIRNSVIGVKKNLNRIINELGQNSINIWFICLIHLSYKIKLIESNLHLFTQIIINKQISSNIK